MIVLLLSDFNCYKVLESSGHSGPRPPKVRPKPRDKRRELAKGHRPEFLFVVQGLGFFARMCAFFVHRCACGQWLVLARARPGQGRLEGAQKLR